MSRLNRALLVYGAFAPIISLGILAGMVRQAFRFGLLVADDILDWVDGDFHV